jgi:prepilin-type N-terminal cleavage/methylation domain-containing protein
VGRVKGFPTCPIRVRSLRELDASYRCFDADSRARPARVTVVRPDAPRGFSLLELLVVLAVTVMLTSLMFPALSAVRENANRVVCSSNLRQIGMSMSMFAIDNDDNLPFSYFGEQPGQKQEMMAAHIGDGDPSNFDGIGLLYVKGYCKDAACFYCPSHTGAHPFERYEREYRVPGPVRIYTNYHYIGHETWLTADNDTPPSPIRFDSDRIVLMTDGLRTQSDFNHRNGMNVLTNDIVVTWQADINGELVNMLPPNDSQFPPNDDLFGNIWEAINVHQGCMLDD